jgi:hypothetical protein
MLYACRARSGLDGHSQLELTDTRTGQVLAQASGGVSLAYATGLQTQAVACPADGTPLQLDTEFVSPIIGGAGDTSENEHAVVFRAVSDGKCGDTSGIRWTPYHGHLKNGLPPAKPGKAQAQTSALIEAGTPVLPQMYFQAKATEAIGL